MNVSVKVEPQFTFLLKDCDTQNRGISVFSRIHLFPIFPVIQKLFASRTRKNCLHKVCLSDKNSQHFFYFFSWSPFEKLCSRSDLNSVKSEKKEIYIFLVNADMTRSWEFQIFLHFIFKFSPRFRHQRSVHYYFINVVLRRKRRILNSSDKRKWTGKYKIGKTK